MSDIYHVRTNSKHNSDTLFKNCSRLRNRRAVKTYYTFNENKPMKARFKISHYRKYIEVITK